MNFMKVLLQKKKKCICAFIQESHYIGKYEVPIRDSEKNPSNFIAQIFQGLQLLFLRKSLLPHFSTHPFLMFSSLSYYPCSLFFALAAGLYSPSVLLNRLQSKLYNNFQILLLKLAATSLLVLHLLSQPALLDVVFPVYKTDRRQCWLSKVNMNKGESRQLQK